MTDSHPFGASWDFKTPEQQREAYRTMRGTLYSLRRGHRSVGPKVIPGIMRAFPDLPFERLFVPVNSAVAQPDSALQVAAA